MICPICNNELKKVINQLSKAVWFDHYSACRFSICLLNDEVIFYRFSSDNIFMTAYNEKHGDFNETFVRYFDKFTLITKLPRFFYPKDFTKNTFQQILNKALKYKNFQ